MNNSIWQAEWSNNAVTPPFKQFLGPSRWLGVAANTKGQTVLALEDFDFGSSVFKVRHTMSWYSMVWYGMAYIYR